MEKNTREKRIKEKNMIFGLHAVIEAVEAGKDIEKIFIRRELGGSLAKELYEKIRLCEIPVQRVPLEKLNRLTDKNHQGVVAFISPITYQDVTSIIPTLYEEGKTPFVVVLDSVTDVRNFGAIARTCECAGVDALIVPAHKSAAANADAVKTSAGALHILPVCRTENLEKTVKFLKDSGLEIICVSEKANKNYTKESYNSPLALVLGAEDIGISPEILKLADSKVSIPILGKIQSLNVSVAAGIVVYEAVKQRFTV
ncbi:MAG: 23S rRNA (guanosine(2251)-2'-O)-methyltransferase RlmB [Prevotellaceae bacterium]|jgi:23S rRNA (guanosine2251-2'-O)-methyltransferase|nr:23S rRNA (guanosine(2251)-2'-O)-methyltransferase RlmB [Prevotellaceae bacterium]